ncbi:SDR family oxidoreductase [Sediminicola sp. 1XM1-17]|uniref:SDR family oxidoreductase n=1 Tax=Sediminicola sp. 1XM1-17 TaxID=3127702 RepID=UPI0030781D7B
MNIILTGATGTLGSKILFSLFEQKFPSIEKVFLPIRSKNSITPEERILKMLRSEYAPNFIKSNLQQIIDKIQVIDATLLLNPKSFLGDVKINFFIHSAGFVNLSTDIEAKEDIFKENFEFTKDIFKAYSAYIKKFIYISTAFAAGDIGGFLDNDYSTKDKGKYRNHYEASKHASEKYLLQAGKAQNIPIQILRPSVLGGNIKDQPHFFISKYMVFYLFAKFFHNSNSGDLIRISTTETAGLNIIPTDYAAKVIVKAMDREIKQLNIVHSKETNLMAGMSKIFDVVGFDNFSFTNEKINAMTGFKSDLEKFYYETIGIHLNPYLTSKPNQWDTSLLESIMPIPSYDLEEYLIQTVSFAKSKKFRSQQW